MTEKAEDVGRAWEKPAPAAWDRWNLYTADAIRAWLERAAVEAWNTGMDRYKQSKHDDPRNIGSMCAAAIRALIKEV